MIIETFTESPQEGILEFSNIIQIVALRAYKTLRPYLASIIKSLIIFLPIPVFVSFVTSAIRYIFLHGGGTYRYNVCLWATPT